MNENSIENVEENIVLQEAEPKQQQQKADIKEITAYLQKQMENLGYKRKPLVHDQFKAYSDLIEMLSVNHPSEVTECEDLARRLKAISL